MREGSSRPAETNGATLRNVGLLIAGIIALPLALWRSFVAHSQAKSAEGQLNATQQSFRQQRYERGAEMLGNEQLFARRGGIYALLRLAEDYPEEYHLRVMELLCDFVRNPHGMDIQPDQTITNWEDRYIGLLVDNQRAFLREDVEAIIHAIGNRRTPARILEADTGFRLDLRGANLTYADLSDLDLSCKYSRRMFFFGSGILLAGDVRDKPVSLEAPQHDKENGLARPTTIMGMP